jgi:MFS family permease
VPLGFLVDRLGAKRMLIAGLALGAVAFALVAVLPSYEWLIAAMVLAGIANGVYHPADYSLLSRGMPSERMGRAFSIHTFAGFFGGALAPPVMVSIGLALAPRWSFAIAALAGLIALVIVTIGLRAPEHLRVIPAAEGPVPAASGARAPLLTLAMLTLMFTVLNLSTGGIERFSVSAFMQGFATTLSVANVALTAYLFASAFGVLAGGVLADRTDKHGYVAAATFALAAVIVVLVIAIPLSPVALTIAWGATGFLTGMVAPSRDMLVRAASPKGAEGRTFGIVSAGFNVGGVIGPVLFGLLLDQGHPIGVFWAVVGFMTLTTIIVVLQELSGG